MTDPLGISDDVKMKTENEDTISIFPCDCDVESDSDESSEVTLLITPAVAKLLKKDGFLITSQIQHDLPECKPNLDDMETDSMPQNLPDSSVLDTVSIYSEGADNIEIKTELMTEPVIKQESTCENYAFQLPTHEVHPNVLGPLGISAQTSQSNTHSNKCKILQKVTYIKSAKSNEQTQVIDKSVANNLFDSAPCKYNSAPYYSPDNVKSNTQIKKRVSYKDQEIWYVNEENVRTKLCIKEHGLKNFNNPASKKYPKLTVTLIRLESIPSSPLQVKIKSEITSVDCNVESSSCHEVKIIECPLCLRQVSSVIELEQHGKLELKKNSQLRKTPNKSANPPHVDLTTNTGSVLNAQPVDNYFKKCDRPEKSISKDNKIKKIDTEASDLNLMFNISQSNFLYTKDKSSIIMNREHFNEEEQAIFELITQPKLVNSKNFLFLCKECNIGFSNTKELVSHSFKKHRETFIKKMIKISEDNGDTAKTDEKIVPLEHYCNVCGFQAYTKSHLQFHMRSHMKEVIVDSTVPGFHAEQKRMKLESSLLKCKYCYASFPNLKLVLSHCKSEHNVKLHQVQYGIRKSDNVVMTNPVKQAKRFVCTICKKMYRGIHSLHDHVFKSHLPLLGNEDPCRIVFVNNSTEAQESKSGRAEQGCELQKMKQKLVSPKEEYTSNEKKYFCHVCYITLDSKQKAQEHMFEEHCETDSGDE